MTTGKGLIYADSGQESVEYLKRHLIVGDSDFLRGYLQGVEALADGLAKLTPVDAVEVIRCKDCVHYNGEGCLLTYGEFEPNLMDFCSYGEMKTDG